MYATDRRQTASSLNAPAYEGRGHNNEQTQTTGLFYQRVVVLGTRYAAVLQS